MTRKKVKLAYIRDDSARKATFKKRKKGILKKVSELTILCGIQACAIISNPFDDSQNEVWPDPEGAKQVIERYQSSVIDESKNMNQESFMLQRIAKAKDQLKKLRKENHEKEMTLSMYEYMQSKELPENLTIADLKDLDKLIDQNMKDIENKIAALG